MKELYAGVMSGTSLDGTDVAFVEIDILDPDPNRPRVHADLIATGYTPYTDDLRERVRIVREGKPVSVADLCRLHFELGEVYAEAIARCAVEANIKLSEVAGVGLHGQTVWHAPPSAGADVPGTLQIGQPAVLAERLGVRIVSDFRARDMAAGGEGAPLVPFVDYLLLASPDEDRVALNIGGIANLTFLPAGGSLADVLAFDTGPGNLLIDGLTQAVTGAAYDTGGALAAEGRVDEFLLAELLSHSYYAALPPKSTGAELFSRVYVSDLLSHGAGMSPADLIATVTRLTVDSIAGSVRRFLPRPPQCLIVGGGGAHNQTLMAGLRSALPEARFETPEAFGIPADAKEALAFALLAAATLHGLPANVPSATGARGPRLLGSITLP